MGSDFMKIVKKFSRHLANIVSKVLSWLKKFKKDIANYVSKKLKENEEKIKNADNPYELGQALGYSLAIEKMKSLDEESRKKLSSKDLETIKKILDDDKNKFKEKKEKTIHKNSYYDIFVKQLSKKKLREMKEKEEQKIFTEYLEDSDEESGSDFEEEFEEEEFENY